MTKHQPHVVIIGGGLAGMSAAAALSSCFGDEGTAPKITLLEAKQITGGRAGSFQAAENETTVDYCQHVGMGCCTNLLHLLEQSGQIDQWRCERSLLFIGPGGQRCDFSATAWLPAPLHLAKAFHRLNYLSLAAKRSIASGIWTLMRMKDSAQRKFATMHEFLVSVNQTEEALSGFWDVILVSALGESTQRVAVAPARKVIVDGFLSNREAFHVWVPQQPLSVLFGEVLPTWLAEQNVDIQTGKRACDVRISKNQNTQPLEIELADISRTVLQADQVVVAVPWHQLKRALGTSQSVIGNIDQLHRIPASPITGIHLWCDRPITQRTHAVFIDRLSQWLFRPSFAESADASKHYHQVVVSASRDLPSRKDLPERVLADLIEVFPEATGARLIDARVITDPKSVFSVTEDVQALRPQAKTASQNIWLAGDWTATGWPATMESAVISGYRAAQCVAQQFGKDSQYEQSSLARGWLARALIS